MSRIYNILHRPFIWADTFRPRPLSQTSVLTPGVSDISELYDKTPAFRSNRLLTGNPVQANDLPSAPEDMKDVFERYFPFLEKTQIEPALHAYESVHAMMKEFPNLPETVWIDIDGTLINTRYSNRDPFVLQGRIIGMMLAFKDRNVSLGIYSYRTENSIINFINDIPEIKKLISKDVNGVPLFRGIGYINRLGKFLAPDSIYFKVHDRFGYYDFSSGKSHSPTVRAAKFIGRNELLIDDDGQYDAFYEAFAEIVPGWSETELAKAVGRSKARFLHVHQAVNEASILFFEDDELEDLYDALDVINCSISLDKK